MTVNSIAALVRLFDRIPVSILLLLDRAIVGLVFFQSGLTKIEGFGLKPGTFFLFQEEYKVPLLPPALAAYMATTAELTMPWLLWLGLGARFAAVALLLMTGVIQAFVYPEAYVTHGLWAIALLAIIKFGAGAISIDHLVRARFEPAGVLPSSER